MLEKGKECALDANAKDKDDNTALILAVDREDQQILNKMLDEHHAGTCKIRL